MGLGLTALGFKLGVERFVGLEVKGWRLTGSQVQGLGFRA